MVPYSKRKDGSHNISRTNGPADQPEESLRTTDGAAECQMMWERCAPLLWGFVLDSGVDAEDASDVVIESFETAWQNRNRCSGPFVRWLLGIAAKRVANDWRARARQRKKLERYAREWDLNDHESAERDEEETTARDRCALQAQLLVLQLPPRQRHVWELRVDAGLKFAAIAKQLGIREDSARSHFRDAKKRLEVSLTAMGFQPPFGEED